MIKEMGEKLHIMYVQTISRIKASSNFEKTIFKCDNNGCLLFLGTWSALFRFQF